MSSNDVDFAHTATAEANRDRKAAALAAKARELGLTAADLDVGGGHRRVVWKAAGLSRAPSHEETWFAAAVLLGLDPGGGERGG